MTKREFGRGARTLSIGIAIGVAQLSTAMAYAAPVGQFTIADQVRFESQVSIPSPSLESENLSLQAVPELDRLLSDSLSPHWVDRDQLIWSSEASGGETVGATDSELGTLRLQPTPIAQMTADPELGTLQLQDAQPNADPELGTLQLQDIPTNADPELGILQLQEPEPQQRRSPSVYLLAGVNYFRSDNVFSDSRDPVDDGLISAGVTLYAQPRLGDDTFLIASIGETLIRYGEFADLNYNEFRVRLGVRQYLSSRMYGEINWTNQQLFSVDDGDRFLNDHALRLVLVRRDPLADRLSLDTFYQFRFSLADPVDRNRLSHSLGASLVYDLSPDLDIALDYQITLTDFTERDREDLYNQLIAELNYAITDDLWLNLYGGFSFGNSSDPDISVNSGIFGLGLNLGLPLF